jgi:hypothetical protein
MVSGTAGDATPFGMTTDGMQNFSETITVYALGWQLFSSDTDRNNATPDKAAPSTASSTDPALGFGSQLDTVAPAAPKTYKSSSATPTVKGDWTLQIANALPYLQVRRVGTGTNAITTVVNAGNNGDLTAYPQLRVDIVYTWTDSNNITRTQVGSTIVSRSGSLP